MLPHILQLRLGEDAGGHVLVLDAVVGQQRRGGAPAQLHGAEVFESLLGQALVAGQQTLQLRQGKAPRT